jgi:hypothetical protein
MSEYPLQDGVLHLLRAARHEEWTLHRVMYGPEREATGTEAEPSARELVAKASANRRAATQRLQLAAAGRTDLDACVPVDAPPAGAWREVHSDAHAAMSELFAAVRQTDEERLAVSAGGARNHPQYLWRDVTNGSAREPMLNYFGWHLRAGRTFEALGVLTRWYEAAHGSGLPTKAMSDASYDLACGLARCGRLDEAMEYLPDAFTYNDRAAVPVLKAWAREDNDLRPLADRPDFRALVGG